MCVSMCEDTTVFVWELSPLCGVIMYVGGLTRRWGWMETAAAVAVTAADRQTKRQTCRRTDTNRQRNTETGKQRDTDRET